MANEARATVLIDNRLGLHARASGKFCKLATAYDAEVTVIKDDYSVRGDSVLDLLMLIAHKGSEIEIVARGPQAEEAVASLAMLVRERFGEPD